MLQAPMSLPEELRLDRYLRDSYAGLVARLRGSFSERIGAEDVVQEALVSAWQMQARGERIHSLDPWMTAAATNLARSRWRTLRAEERALGRVAADPLSDPSPALDLSPARRFDGPVADAVRELPPRQAQVVLLHYFGDLTVRETADRLGVSQGTVNGALHDARARLGRSMGFELRNCHKWMWIGVSASGYTCPMASRHPRIQVPNDPELRRAISRAREFVAPRAPESQIVRALALRGAQAFEADEHEKRRTRAFLVEVAEGSSGLDLDRLRTARERAWR